MCLKHAGINLIILSSKEYNYHLLAYISVSLVSNLDSSMFWNGIQVRNKDITWHVNFYMALLGSLRIIPDRRLLCDQRQYFRNWSSHLEIGTAKEMWVKEKKIHAPPWCPVFHLTLQCHFWRLGYHWKNRIKSIHEVPCILYTLSYLILLC